MSEPLITFSQASVTIEGKLFEGNAALRVKGALSDEVGRLAEHGRRLVVAGIKTRNGTGFTAAHIEVHRKPANSLYATIRMEPKLERPPGSTRYPASRRAYVINAVLASGRYGGNYTRVVRIGRTGRARSRKVWQQGVRTRPALNMYAKAAAQLRREAAAFRAELIAKELE